MQEAQLLGTHAPNSGASTEWSSKILRTCRERKLDFHECVISLPTLREWYQTEILLEGVLGFPSVRQAGQDRGLARL